MKKSVFALAAAVAASSFLSAADIKLSAPDKKGGIPLMQALDQRKTIRSYSEKALPMQIVSELFWAASGVNRPDGRMTAPTARNLQEITLYAVLPSGVFRYDAKKHTLVQVSGENITQNMT